MAEFNVDKMAKTVAEKALDDYVYQGKTIREWIAIIAKNAWIPVSERSPEKTGLYLISIGDLVTTGSFDGYNFRTQTMVRFVPDAWMPLPDPYEEGESK